MKRTGFHRGLLVHCVLLAALSPAYAAEEGWIQRGDITHPSGNLSLYQKWDPARGLQLGFRAADGQQGLALDLKPGGATVGALGENSLSPNVTDTSDLYANRLPTTTRERVPLVVKVRPEAWTVYVANRPVASFPPPFPLPATLSAPTSQLPPPDDVRVRFQRVEDLAFQDNFLVPEEEENVLSQWEMLSGEWHLHTALDTVLARQALAEKSRVLEAQRSPNFYSLQGAGTNAVIAHGYPFHDTYDVEAAMQVSTGEMGIVFYLQDTQQFHAFTIRIADDGHNAELRLWRRHPETAPDREVLAAARTPLTPEQWVKLKVRTYGDRVICFLDGTAVIDREAELPVGGSFGLFIDSNTPARFDDVLARSNHDLDLRTKRHIRRHLLHQEGQMLPGRRLLGLLPPAEDAGTLKATAAKSAQWLAIGSPHQPGHVFETEFEDMTGTGGLGLIVGYSAPDEPHFRFVFTRTASNEVFRLERASGTGAVVLEQLTLPATTERKRVELMSDATCDGELRLYRDHELVLFHHATNSVAGASGVYVGAHTGATVPALRHRARRTDLFHSRYEKNPLFSTDPYMLHWSSPGGQWITMKDGLTWHRSDFFGRFLLRMPHAPGSEIHLGVAEGQTNGALVVSATADSLVLREAARALASAPATELVVGEASNACYTVHCEDHWLWLTTGNKVLFKHALPRPLAGTRVRIKGFTQALLKYSYVERHNVKDFLFTESSHDWTVNGGQWDVVNRFQCDPRWSHMNGESAEGLAALWGKHQIEGDFCIEFYAGVRHGTAWYARCGDLNLTVMNRETTPSQGYTITCTGWDFDHSQRLSHLLREGEVVQESDKYLVPRSREGNVRRGYEPMIPIGNSRDVHGAWYYMKFRRIGNKLEYFFDNERVFSYEDPQPLASGSFGIWTYLNSMVIARINVAATRLTPRAVPFETVPLKAQPPEPKDPTSPFRLVNHGRPLELSTPGHWQTEDPVGHARIAWGVTPDNADAFTVESVLGSGPMFARCTLPPVPYEALAGWRFYVKRTPRAQFNFHYSVGKVADGEYKPEHAYFHRLSGTGFSKGALTLTGETEVPGTPATNAGWQVSSPWTAVDVWVPAPLAGSYHTNEDAVVKLEGFGNLQPSFVRQGLYGNGPGEAFAVRGLTEIRYGKPTLEFATATNPPLSFALLDGESGQRLCAHPSFDAMQSWIGGSSPTGLVRAVLLAEWKTVVAGKELAWVNLPAKPQVDCRWGRDRGDQIDLVLDAPYPDRRFSCGTVAIGGETVQTARDGFARRIAGVPRIESLAGGQAAPLEVTLATRDQTYAFALKHDDPHPKTVPVLLELDGPAAFFENFEHGTLRAPLDVTSSRMRIRHSDPQQGAYLEVFNPGAAYKLKHSFTASLQLSQAPVFQFRYKAEPMSQVSLYLGYNAYVPLSENYSKASPVRHGEPLKRDNAWHTWTGVVSDAVKGQRLSRYWFTIQRFGIASLSATDQTGLHSTFAIDDVVVGPAVTKAEQLRLTPHYYDRDGQPTVLIATRQGPKAYAELPPEETVALVWDKQPNGQPCTPSLSGLSNGVCHLFVKARGEDGAESAVTDIPFLLDRDADKLAYAFRAVEDQQLNGTLLDVTIGTSEGAPVDLGKVALSWKGEVVKPLAFGSTFAHTPAKEILSLNWPFLLREQINALTNTQTGTLVIGDVVDGAGNPSTDLAVPITIDYTSDKTPPTMLEADYPSNIVWCAEWEERSYKRLQRQRARRFAATEEHEVELITLPGTEPFFQHRTLQEASEISQDFEKPYWRLDASPYLCFEIRRPNMKPADKTEMYLLLETDASKRMVIWLTPEKDGKTVPGLPKPIDWTQKKWHTVNVNLKALYEERYAPKTKQDVGIKRIRLRVRNGRPKLLLQVRNVFAFGKWQERDAVRINTYDASGIAGTTWAYAKGPVVPENGDAWHSLDTTHVAPAFLPAPDPEHMWIVMRARDRAGNDSVPTRVPVAR